MWKKCALILLTIIFAFSLTVACAVEFDFASLSAYELNQLGSDITSAKEKNFTKLSASEENTVLQVVKEATEKHFLAQGIDISWAWVNYTYTREWCLLKVSTHIDYRDSNNQKHKDGVYGEAYPIEGKYEIVYLTIDSAVIIDNRSKLPTQLWEDVDNHIVNQRTGIDLTVLPLKKLNTLSNTVAKELETNHRVTDSEHDTVKNIVKDYVENYYRSIGVTSVEWPWFDYSCQRDWGRFAETTRLSYRNDDGKKVSLSVYAEVYNDTGSNEVFYLKIGDQIIADRRIELTNEYCMRYQKSQAFDQAWALLVAGRYSEAEEAFRALGTFSNSSLMVERCQQSALEEKYKKANQKFNKKQYEEARKIYLELGSYSDAEEKAAKCTEAINEKLYKKAMKLYDDGDYYHARSSFEEIREYKNSEEMITACQEQIDRKIYDQAVTAMNEGNYEVAREKLNKIPNFNNAQDLMSECVEKNNEKEYARAKQLLAYGHYDDAYAVFEALDGYEDSENLALECLKAKENADRSIIINETDIMLFKEKKAQLTPTVELRKTTAPETTRFLYKSTDTTVVKVSQNGTISAVGEGEASVLCYAEDNPNVITEVKVRVVLPVKQIKLDKSAVTILFNQDDPASATYTLVSTILPNTAYDQSIIWESSNEDVAKVNKRGVVKAVAPGRAIITATANDQTNGIKKATCTVNVELAVSNISLSATDETVLVGQSEMIQATIEPETAKNKKITWSSSDTSVATVSSNGTVKGISSGTAVITATAVNGVTSEYKITVKQGPATFSITAKATLIERNHVGSRWTKEFSIGDKDFSGSTTFTAEVGETVRFSCFITENDSNPDIGSYFERITITEDILKNGYTINENVYVRENGGRYAGNVAEWSLKVTIKKK